MRMPIYIAALGLLAAAGCSQTDYGYRPQTAALPDAGFDNVPYVSYAPRYYSNPAINSATQAQLYAHPE